MAEGRDGRLALWTDEGDVVVVARATALNGALAYGSKCAGCHGTNREGTRLGPSLQGIVLSKIAAREGFAYSPALKRVGGVWTTEQLLFFIQNPGRCSL